MTVDPNDEILAIKRRLSDQFNNDVHLIAEDTRQRQRQSGRKVLTLPPRMIPLHATTNKPMHGSGEAAVVRVENLSSPPRDP
jgi:hypothetical protein